MQMLLGIKTSNLTLCILESLRIAYFCASRTLVQKNARIFGRFCCKTMSRREIRLKIVSGKGGKIEENNAKNREIKG